MSERKFYDMEASEHLGRLDSELPALPELIAVVKAAEEVRDNRSTFLPIGESYHLDAMGDALDDLIRKLGVRVEQVRL